MEEAILRRVCALGFKNRGVKRSSGLAVLKHVFNRGVSHALVEICFIDDRDDMDLYGREFDAVARAIADGVAEGFGKAVQEPEKEDDEVVQKKTVAIDGNGYICNVIMKDGYNYSSWPTSRRQATASPMTPRRRCRASLRHRHARMCRTVTARCRQRSRPSSRPQGWRSRRWRIYSSTDMAMIW